MLLANSQKRIPICWNDSYGSTQTLLLENCTRNIISGSEENAGTVQQRLNVVT